MAEKFRTPIKTFTVFLAFVFLGIGINSAEFEWKGQKYKSGLKYKLYHGEFDDLPAFSALTPVKNGIVENFKLDIKDRNDNFAVVFEGYIRLPAGEYTFYLDSDDGSKLFLDGKELINYGGLHGMGQPKSGTVTLEKGVYPIKVLYFEKGGSEVLEVKCEGPHFQKQNVPAKALFHKE